ncbi:hypothetical protein [Flavobacterium sp.]|uniref:hypothetical protein n=1 Tax=Flavobacterium sp. TaxID=239 RepID=UPI00260FC177|nr:hypothetical protein [Flavobacterium sp.]
MHYGVIKGEFYFNLTINGNLIGEFTHDKMPDNCWDVECANKFGERNDGFIGKFISTWLEDKKSHTTILSIQKLSDIEVSLVWNNLENKTIFKGMGKIDGATLSGEYTSAE